MEHDDDCRCPDCRPFASDADYLRWLAWKAGERPESSPRLPPPVQRGPSGLLPGDEDVAAARLASLPPPS